MKRTILVASLALALLAGGAPSANGGVYRAIQCHERIGAGHADATFEASSPSYQPSASCAARGLGVTHLPAPSRTGRGRFGAWTIAAPSGTQIIRATAGVTAERANAHVPQVHIGLEDGTIAPLADVEGSPHTIRWAGTGGEYFSGRLACAGRTGCGEGQDAHLYMRRIAMTLRDDLPPAVRLGGTLVERGSRRGDQFLEVSATDAGSGVRSISVELNDNPIQARVFECHIVDRVATRLQPCPGEAAPRFEIATTTAGFRQGPNQLRVCASDFGPRATANRACETRTVRVDNGCPLSDSTGSGMQARFERAGAEVTTPSDAPTFVTGQVFDQDGAPVSGTRVCVATRVAMEGSQEHIISTPVTGPNGEFEARLPGGPSREVRIAYWRGPHDVVERFLALHSKAVPRLELRPRTGVQNGESVRFDVRIPGPARGDRQVAVEAKADGRWVTVASGRTDRSGRWTGSYEFRNTTGTRLYAFRALVARQSDYPYLPGRSKVRHLKVTGS